MLVFKKDTEQKLEVACKPLACSVTVYKKKTHTFALHYVREAKCNTGLQTEMEKGTSWQNLKHLIKYRVSEIIGGVSIESFSSEHRRVTACFGWESEAVTSPTGETEPSSFFFVFLF